MLFTAQHVGDCVRRSQHRSDVLGGSPEENPRARRHVRPIFAQRPSDLHEPRHVVCCIFRSGSAGGARDAFAGAGPSRLQQLCGSAQFDFSQTGTLIYRSGGAGGGLFTVQWLDAAGKTQPLLAKPDAYVRPSLSPDGGEAWQLLGRSDIWVYDWQRDTMTRLTFGPGASIYPIWSPDSRYILYRRPGGIFWTRSDGQASPSH